MQALGLTNQLDLLFRFFLCSLDITQKSHQQKEQPDPLTRSSRNSQVHRLDLPLQKFIFTGWEKFFFLRKKELFLQTVASTRVL